MPLADFVRYLNAQLPHPPSGLHSTAPFVSEGGRVHVVYSGLRLESVFSPIVDVASGQLRGHGARLLVIDAASKRPFSAEVAYALPQDGKEFIVLDRLIRTLHTLNYLTYGDRQSRELLLLKVHPRHVASVAVDHGLAFEEILRSCGLMPGQVTLEFDILGGGDFTHLVQALANYRSRGYGIAIGRFTPDDIAFDLLREIRPAVVKVDPQIVASSAPLGRVVDQLHALGARVLGEGPECSARRDGTSGVDLWQVQTPWPRLAHGSAAWPPGADGAAPCKAA